MSRPPVRAVFLGTPEASVPTLMALAKITEVVAVITRPDKPRGRSGHPLPSPVKEAATRLDLCVLQPTDPSELTSLLKSIDPPDIGVVTAYGSLIRPEALTIPARGFLNVHFSILPRWRGASPVVAALLAGDEETGVTLMQLDQGLDTGPIVAARSVVIGHDETGGELTKRLANLGAELVAQYLLRWVGGALPAVPQPGFGVTVASKVKKADQLLDPTAPADTLVRQIRALAPAPGALLRTGEGQLRVLAARAADRNLAVSSMLIVDGRVLIGTGAGALELLTVHPSGKRPMAAAAWARGLRPPPTEIGP